MQDATRQTRRPLTIDGSIRVRISTERPELANHLARILGAARHIELLLAAGAAADVLILDCAVFPFDSTASLQKTARRHQPARVLWMLDTAPAGNQATRRVLKAVRDGWCDGFIVGDWPAETVLRAIAAVAAHEVFLPRSMLTHALVASGGWRPSRVAPVPAPRAGRSRALLTVRERQVLQQVRRGLTSKEAGHNLGIKEDTMKKHLRNIYAKLGVRGRSQLLLKTTGRDRLSD